MTRFFIVAAILLATLIWMAPAESRDGWGDRPRVCADADMRCQEWIANVRQPDNGVSCCADADSFITDDFETKNGQFYAIVTVPYPGIPAGTRIPIPPNKINRANEDGGNPSGHSVTFAVAENGPDGLSFYTYCYFSGTLS